MTKLAKVEDIEQVDKTINSLVRVLKEMTSELKIQHVINTNNLTLSQKKKQSAMKMIVIIVSLLFGVLLRLFA